MLEIAVPLGPEYFDEEKEVFVKPKMQILRLEHSLVSLSKWESKWNKAFLGKQEKTFEETIDYIKCMTLTQNVKPEVYENLTSANIEDINRYIEAPMTATCFSEMDDGKPSKDTVTSELIYYWMIAFNIPVEFQKWHLNKLLTLIKVCNVKNAPPKQMSRQEIAARNRRINAANRKRFNSKG